MAKKETTYKLSTLTERQVEVLQLVCSGNTYSDIGDQLFIAESTVKAHMGNIYQKLGLDELPPTQRTKTLFESYCPALHEGIPASDLGPSEPEPVPERVERMVEDDEKALEIWRPQQIIEVKPVEIKAPRRPRRWLWLLVGVILGTLVVAVPLIYFRDMLQLLPTSDTSPQTEPKIEYVPVTVEVPKEVVVTATVDPNRPEPTTVIQQVVVTATPMPSPTAPEITPPDAVLEIGEWWKTESIWVRIPELEITDHGLIYIKMDVWNKSEQDLLFSWSVPKNISMVDNTGHVYARYDFINRHDISQRVDSDALLSLDSGYGCAVVYEDFNYFEVAVTDLYLTVTDLSRLSHAKFHIPVPK